MPKDIVTTAHPVKLHVDPASGTVWSMSDSHAPGSTGLSAVDFAVSLDPRAGPFRVLGSRSNAPLITALWAVLDAPAIDVGRPGHVDWAVLAPKGPAATLKAMHQVDADASSRGGWHRLNRHEVAAYTLVSVLHNGDVKLVDMVLRTHPAWRALSFIDGLHLPSAARTIAAILDPRWFVDPDHPDSPSRLKSYLGLAVVGRPGEPAKQQRRSDVLSTWNDGFSPVADTPGAFLRRYQVEHHGTEQVAELAACRCFLNYLRWTWLDAVTPPRTLPGIRHDQGLFIPEHFFKRSCKGGREPDYATAGAFRRHMATARCGAVNYQ